MWELQEMLPPICAGCWWLLTWQCQQQSPARLCLLPVALPKKIGQKWNTYSTPGIFEWRDHEDLRETLCTHLCLLFQAKNASCQVMSSHNHFSHISALFHAESSVCLIEKQEMTVLLFHAFFWPGTNYKLSFTSVSGFKRLNVTSSIILLDAHLFSKRLCSHAIDYSITNLLTEIQFQSSVASDNVVMTTV